MKQLFDWSRPRTWVLVGLVIAVLGAVVMSLQDDEGGIGQAVLVVGVILMLIGGVTYLVTQVRKGIAASRED